MSGGGNLHSLMGRINENWNITFKKVTESPFKRGHISDKLVDELVDCYITGISSLAIWIFLT